ncbi:MAG: 1,4-dihydroxy-6-naphthoate synthase [Alistipes sp.]|nr:1,4-dihydroxy-6-naphthoate synthase [Alistipes sp.]
MRLSLNISPCPNDTFMFDGLINGRIDTRGYSFEVNYFDIEELNRRVMGERDCSGSSEGSARSGCSRSSVSSGCSTRSSHAISSARPSISKISYAVLPEIASAYTVLDSGSALGHGNGPLLVARAGFGREREFSVSSDFKVAVPGIHTTANMLLKRLFPGLTDRTPVLFSDIAPAVARGEFDAGVLIHEGRFTFRDHGLELVADLGVEWERATRGMGGNAASATESAAHGVGVAAPHVERSGLPLPLGAIVASRDLPPGVVRDVEELIRRSVEYAFAHPAESREFVKSHAREMDDDVIDSHIALFVNENSLSLSPAARLAVRELTGVEI